MTNAMRSTAEVLTLFFMRTILWEHWDWDSSKNKGNFRRDWGYIWSIFQNISNVTSKAKYKKTQL